MTGESDGNCVPCQGTVIPIDTSSSQGGKDGNAAHGPCHGYDQPSYGQTSEFPLGQQYPCQCQHGQKDKDDDRSILDIIKEMKEIEELEQGQENCNIKGSMQER